MRLFGLDLAASSLLLFSLSKHCLCNEAPHARRSQSTVSDREVYNSSQHQLDHASYSSLYQSNNASNSSNPAAVSHAFGARPVYLVLHVRLTGVQTFLPTYEKLFPVYASLHVNGSSTDGPLEVQLINHDQNIIRVTDWGLRNNDKPMGIPQPGYLTDYFELFGKTNLTNRQILDPSTGKGLIHDVWSRNTSLALKSYNSIDFMHACIAQLGLGLAPSNNPKAIIPSRIALAQTYWRNVWVAEKVVTHYPIWYETLSGWGTQVQKSRAEFHWEVGANPSAGMIPSHPIPLDQASTNHSTDNHISDLAAPGMTEAYLASGDTVKSAPDYQYIYAQPTFPHHIQRRVDPPMVSDTHLVLNPGDEYAVGTRLVEETDIHATRPASIDGTDIVPPADRPTDATISRIGSRPIMQLVRKGFGVAAAISTFAIIVVDIKEKHVDGLIFGLVSGVALLAGLGFYSLMGPALVPEFLMIASMLIGEVPDIIGAPHPHASWKRESSAPMFPLKTDVQGILQYTIVGDRNQTGNEKCLNKGYKDCKVVYGPYFLAKALQIEPFDAFAILIHYNDGYPMCMTDLIKAFTLSTAPDSGNQVATIDCSHSTHQHQRNPWADTNFRTIQQQCNRPIFSVKRPLITIPILNQTADAIYDRLMPQGNCSLIGDVTGGEKFAAYNITVRGGAVSIACGIVGAIDMNGTASALPGTQVSPNSQSIPLALVNPGNQSSDGSSGRGYLAPPPITPFQTALNLSNSICLSALPGGNTFWLPNGTYSRQDGSLGFDTTKANALSLAANSSIVVTETAQIFNPLTFGYAYSLPPTYVNHENTYTTNQSVADVNFAQDMQDMIKYKTDNTFAVNVPTQPDAACFYQQPLGKGNFACFGPGGGDLSPGLKNNIRSVKAYGRASVEIFAKNYGNSFAHIVDTYEDDLAHISYDKDSNFGNVASAIWVYLEPGPTIPTTSEK